MPKRVKPTTHMKQKSRYYARGRAHADNSREAWSDEDIAIILERKSNDSHLAILIGRSVQAIQVKRSRLTEKKEKE
jgi:hypothetical protein